MQIKAAFYKSLKIALAAVISIAIAGELGLQHSATAGIITVLSIQNTKRETLHSARNRGIAFLCALGISFGCFSLMGYTLWAFAVYLLLFAMLCFQAKWAEAISMDSVLITHFLVAENFSLQVLGNEVLLFLIGTSMGILVNLHLRRKGEQFTRLAEAVDNQIKDILGEMALWLPREDRAGYTADSFQHLKEALKEAELCAAANYNNAIFGGSTYELDYISMREQQSVVLREIYENIKRIKHLPNQAGQMAELIKQIQESYHRDNTVEGLMARLKELLADMQGQKLPISREEFEARAILFYILVQLQNLLQIKMEFLNTEECQDRGLLCYESEKLCLDKSHAHALQSLTEKGDEEG